MSHVAAPTSLQPSASPMSVGGPSSGSGHYGGLGDPSAAFGSAPAHVAPAASLDQSSAFPPGSKRPPSAVQSPPVAGLSSPTADGFKRIKLVSSSSPSSSAAPAGQPPLAASPGSQVSGEAGKVWGVDSAAAPLKTAKAVASPAGTIPPVASSSSSDTVDGSSNNAAVLANNKPAPVSAQPSPAPRPSSSGGVVVSILPQRSPKAAHAAAAFEEPGSNKASLSDPLMSLQAILAEQPNCKGLGQLVTFAASTPIAAKDHTQLLQDVNKVLQRESEMRRDLVEFEEVMHLNPAAVYYGRKPSAVFPELDADFPSHEYDEILFMRQFVSFMITRLQLVTGLCPARSKEQEMVNNIVRSWWQRSMDYI